MVQRGDYSYKRLERWLTRKKVNLRDYKIVVVPINLTHYHWLLLVVDQVNNKFYVVDSMRTNEEKAQTYVNTFITFYKDYLSNNP
jgi:sentrin-specific protease 1